MINSEKFLASLLPNFEQARIGSTIDIARKEYTETLIPVYERTEKAFKANTLKLLPGMEASAKANLSNFRGDIVGYVLPILRDAQSKFDLCEKIVEEHFQTNITKESMTFGKMNALRFVQVMDFTGMYARRLLLALYVQATARREDVDFDGKLHGRETKWLVDNQLGFYRSLEILQLKTKDLEYKFKNIPHLSMVQGQVTDAEDVVGRAKTDPARLGFVPHKLNPIFHLRVIWENYQEGRRKSTIEEVRQLELYLLILEDDKKVTPAVKRELEYSKERLIKARRKLKIMEEDADE